MSSEKLKSNASKINSKLNTLQKLSSQHKYRKFWADCKPIVEMFKSLRLSKEDRERLWSKYSNICERAKHKIESRRGESKVNATIIKSEISNLKDKYIEIDSLGYNSVHLNQAHKEFWSQAKRIGEFFKYLPTLREDREELWAEYDGLCKGIRTKQEAHKKGREDATTGNIDLRRYATDNEYKTAFETEEIRRLCPNLWDLESRNYLKWYHQLKNDRKAEHELDKTYRRAKEERNVLEKTRKKRDKEIKKLLGKGLLRRIKNLSGRRRERHWRAPNEVGEGY